MAVIVLQKQIKNFIIYKKDIIKNKQLLHTTNLYKKQKLAMEKNAYGESRIECDNNNLCM